MTARFETKTAAKRVASSSLVARARKYHLIRPLFLFLILQLEPTESGFSPASETPNWQQQQQQQQPMVRRDGPPGQYQSQQLMRQPVQNVYPMQQQPSRDYPSQALPNYPAQAPNYPMQPRNYPMQQHQIPPRAPENGQVQMPVPIPTGQPPQQRPQPRQRSKTSKSDPCGAINISEMHGYQVRQYKVLTKDNYELVVHRLIHPADVKRMMSENLDSNGRPPNEEKLRRMEPNLGDKKPYLLLHGLVGSSASFVRNVDKNYLAPQETYNVGPEMEAILKKRANDNEHNWQSTADKLNAAFVGDTSNTIESLNFAQKLTNSYTKRTYAKSKLIDFYGDKVNFAYEFTQAFRKFEMPRESLNKGKYVPNSLAFTLSNFGYDVWLVNLRGNEYSRGFNGPLNVDQAEYWDFDLDRLIREDLLATVNQVKKTLGWKQQHDNDRSKTIGIVSYSYSSLHVLGLLTKFPQYQQSLQPVIMMAPALLSTSDKSSKLMFVIRKASKLISHTGPFPNRSEMRKKISIEGMVCKLPIASKLCNLMTIILNGQTNSMKDIIMDDRQQALMLRDSQCGQTSTGVLHQIVENISQSGILPKYTPYVGAREKLKRGDLRRSIMIIRSQADEMANEAETERIKEAAIKGMTLSEVVIEEPKFGHTDFLFSKKNQYLVNAEVARMALVFDFVALSEWANQKIDMSRGK